MNLQSLFVYRIIYTYLRFNLENVYKTVIFAE